MIEHFIQLLYKHGGAVQVEFQYVDDPSPKWSSGTVLAMDATGVVMSGDSTLYLPWTSIKAIKQP